MNFFLLNVSYFILRLNNLKYFVLQQKLVLVNSVALMIVLNSFRTPIDRGGAYDGSALPIPDGAQSKKEMHCEH